MVSLIKFAIYDFTRALVLFCIIFPLECYAGSARESANLQVNVIFKGVDIYLKVSLENKSNSELTIYKADVPWASSYSMTLVALTDDYSSIRLNEELPIDDPVAGQITLKPFQKITGFIILNQRFPKLLEVLKNKSVIVFSYYHLKPLSNQSSQRFSNGIFLEKR